MADDEIEHVQRDIWLRSNITWKDTLGPDWVGRKVLGRGSYGVVGLWEYRGSSNPPPAISQVAVKSVMFSEDESEDPVWEREGLIMKQLQSVRSPHLVRMFGDMSRDKGVGGGDDIVIHLFLEFCPGGDLDSLLEDFYTGRKHSPAPKEPLLEADIWAIFHCLALGVSAMDRGTEDPTEIAWNRETHIVHYDLHCGNVLLGSKDSKHPRVPLAKLADFGVAREEPKGPKGVVKKIARKHRQGGALYYIPPENNPDLFKLRKSRRGPYTNIYQIGCIMHCLICRRSSDFLGTPQKIHSNYFLWLRLKGVTQGPFMEDEGIKKLYSKSLRELVMECMLQEPLSRPSTLDLVKRTKEGRDIAAEKTKSPSNDQPWENAWKEVPFIDRNFPEPPTILKAPLWNTRYTPPEGTTNSTPKRSPSIPGSGTTVNDVPSDMDVDTPIILPIPKQSPRRSSPRPVSGTNAGGSDAPPDMGKYTPVKARVLRVVNI